MRYYPAFINLRDKTCLVVGAGQVGARKIRSLLDCGAGHVLVVDTAAPTAEMATLAEHPDLTYARRTFEPSDIEDKFLVIASTDNEELNWAISNLCRERGILCNIVDQPEKCSFIVPAVFTRGDLTLAVSTGGSSPALAKKIRRDLDDYFGTHYGVFLALMARLRPMVMDLERGTDYNSDLFRNIVASGLIDALADENPARAEEILADVLPEELRPRAAELIHEFD